MLFCKNTPLLYASLRIKSAQIGLGIAPLVPAMGLFTDAIADTKCIYDSGPLRYGRVIHSPRADDFALKISDVRFRLYRWDGTWIESPSVAPLNH